MMFPDKPWCLIDSQLSKWHVGINPSHWSIVKIGRETPRRIYKLADKGWPDPYWDKGTVVGRFETQEEAEFARTRAMLGVAVEAKAYADARQARGDAQSAENAALVALKATVMTKIREIKDAS